MSKPSRPGAQLDLRLSVEASADLAQQMAAAQWRIEELQAELLAQTHALAKLDARYAKSTKVAAYWERRAKQAEADRRHLYETRLEDADHPLHTECQKLTREVEDLRRTLRQWVERTLSGRSHSLAPSDISKADLTKLLTLAHPDKWSQGQPATALAHELSVVINQMREGATA